MSLYSSSVLFTSIASLFLAIFVFFRGKDKTPNITLALFAISFSIWCLGQFMGDILSQKALVLLWTRVGIAGAIFIPVFFMHFTFALIGEAAGKVKLIIAAYCLATVFLLLDFTPFFVADVAPVMSFRFYPQPGPVYLYFAVFVIAAFLYAFWRLLVNVWQASGARKNQLLYVLLAAVIGFSGGVTTFLPIWGINFPVLSHFTLPLYVLITIYAIVKHKLLDISVIVRQGLVYSTLTVFFAGFYVLAVLAANNFLASYTHINSLLTIILVVFVSVILFQPLRNKVQQIVDRIFFQGEFIYQQAIADLSSENLKLYRSLLQADKLASLGTISAGLAHEIKNPLAALKGMTQVLGDNIDDPEFIKDYQELVDRQINRLNGLVEKMLRIGQKQGLNVSQFDLNRTINEVAELLKVQLRKNNIQLRLELGQLPLVQGDEEQLSQVVMNLMLNAIQAMPTGGAITIKSKVQSPTSLIIEVMDSGQGIPADQLDKIFDPFFTTKDEGTGMGLAVAYRIIKEHNGEIKVESQMKKGTVFSIWLPIKPERSA
ncbi:MAG: ATP-binding protein [bacterium]